MVDNPSDRFLKPNGTQLTGTFSRFRPFKALVLGDFLLDSYTTGRVKRISPEAPVPVLEVLSQEERPGGAGNAALNLAVIGGNVSVVGRIGDDAHGIQLKECLQAQGIETGALCVEAGYRTPVKTRLIADSQQLLRVDHETIAPINAATEETILAEIAERIPQAEIVAISDYGKGFVTSSIIAFAIETARKAKVPIIIDPKGSDFTKYRRANILKPNLSEAYSAAKMPPSASLDAVAAHLLQQTEVDLLLITRSEAGMSLFDRNGGRTDFPVRSKEVIDVTGAGDTVLALISLAVAIGIEIDIGVQLANIAAGIAIERLGCVQVSLSDLAHRLLEYDCNTKIFDEDHSYALEQVLRKRTYSLLFLEPDVEMFSMIRILKELNREDLVVYVSDPNPSEELVHLLSSMREIEYILLHKMGRFCAQLQPEKVYRIKEGRAVFSSHSKSCLPIG